MCRSGSAVVDIISGLFYNPGLFQCICVRGIASSGDPWIGRMQRRTVFSTCIGIIFFLLFFIGLSDRVYATHEADHRFTITGYVRDETGNPISDTPVSLEHKGGVKQETKSDHRGYYEAMFHLHNDNLGDEILVSVGDVVKKVAVQFDPEDAFTDRRSVPVNFGAPGKEIASDWVYWAGGMGLILSAVAYLRFFKKKKPSQKRRKKDKSRRKK